ncbi:MAG TPA: ABC transporter ATP-binding protein [Acidimicrobiales bacterium]|jgi:branched-chain amino acid transport system ATP-binding protein|nr:ABC transporter ATP-binding protein [Acidimicrobiales bacterium]
MLELRDICAGYDGHDVLRDVSIVVPDHSVVAVLGPNGAGKTTLLKVASGLLHPTSGEILVDGQDVTRRPPHELAALGVCHVPEGRGIFPTLSVRDNLRLQAPRDLDASTVDAVRAVFPKLIDRLDQTAGTMSGGEQQMLALAHAYLAEPEVVLLDEVSMGLAPLVVDEIFDYLRKLADAGTSLLLVEQYVARALDLADYVYIVGKGRITFAGEPDELESQAIAASYLGER